MYIANGYEKFDKFFNIEIHYVMPLFEEMVINFEPINLSKILCILTTNNTDYLGCGCKMCYFTCVEGIIFESIVVKRLKWLNMERPCAKLCIMSPSQCGWQN